MLLVLLVAALVPTACVLWFMNAAMSNERLAVRQKLTDVYRQKAQTKQDEIAAFWSSRMPVAADGQGAQLFAAIVRSGIADSAIVRGGDVTNEVNLTLASPFKAEGYPSAAFLSSVQSDEEPVEKGDRHAAPSFAEATEGKNSAASQSPFAWAKAQELEYVLGRPVDAAGAYAAIAAGSREAETKARALAAQARCLAKAGDRPGEVAKLVQGELSAQQYRNAVDAHGRLIVPNVQLLALEIMAGSPTSISETHSLTPEEHVAWLQKAQPRHPAMNIAATAPGTEENSGQGNQAIEKIAAALARRVEDYGDAAMLAPQRLFLMKAMQEGLGVHAFNTLAAEELAREYLDAAQPAAQKLRVTPTVLPAVWQMARDDGTVLLFREARLISDLKAACKLDEPSAGITTRLELPGRPAVRLRSPQAANSSSIPRPQTEGGANGREASGEPFLAVPASELLPGWQLAVYLDEDPFAASARKAESAYLAAGVSAVAVIAVLAVGMASYLGRQIRLTRLKNDLIATVSHELKTPLASMRVLVDTLREGRCSGVGQAAEYFELIAKENERLSRLIDNFLTFSRMERNKRAFEFAPMAVAEAVEPAVAAAGERFCGAGSRLDVDLAADLPKVRADRDAMVTVMLNLLDNAWKYSGDTKAVKVRAFAAGPSVFIEVSDNGVGMSRRAIRRIFDKFYQVDQTLSRKAGGCGLGLSIVKFILDAHGGAIDVKSQPGKGSVFTIRLPVVGNP